MKSLILVRGMTVLVMALGCSDVDSTLAVDGGPDSSSAGDGDADTDTDADSDTDSDTDSDVDSDTDALHHYFSRTRRWRFSITARPSRSSSRTPPSAVNSRTTP